MSQFSWNDLKMDLETQELVKLLIKNEKNPENEIAYDKIEAEVFETFHLIEDGRSKKMNCKVIDHKRNVDYLFNVLITDRPDTYSISLLSYEFQRILLRFDFGQNQIHTNNYGTKNVYKVIGPHVHVFDLPQKYAEKNVIPISELEDFVNLRNIADVCHKFIKETNIKRRC